MCLDEVQKQEKLPSGFGYKVFHKKGKLLEGEFSRGERPIGKWLNEKDSRRSQSYTSIGYVTSYHFGFHVFKTRKGIAEWGASPDFGLVTYRVRYRKAHTMGTQHGHTVIVAREIKILEEIKI